ncbi:MAG: MFS transporter [Leptospiraceae bacterium]|nr:MFS transporter [Leptospiraceae bacterium]
MNTRKNRFILFLTVFIDMLGFSVIFPIFPELLEYFSNSKADPVLSAFLNLAHFLSGSEEISEVFIVLFGGLLGSIYAVLQFIFAPIWGKISDRKGRKPILIFTTLGSVLGYLVWFLSKDFSLFVLSRVITGAMGGNISVASASMADSTTQATRAKGMGMIGAGIGLGFILGPSFGGILSRFKFVELGFSHTIFPYVALTALIFATVNLTLMIFVFKETLVEKNETKTILKHPVLSLADSSMKELPFFSFIYFLFTFSFSGFEFVVNFFFKQSLGLTPMEIGYSFVYMGLVIVFIQGGVIRRISGKIPEIQICIAGNLFLVVGFICIYFSNNFFMTFFSLTLLSIGNALFNPGISALTSLYSSPLELGKNLGILRGFGSMARAFAPFIFSFVYFKFGFKNSFLLSSIIFIMLSALIYKLKYSLKNPKKVPLNTDGS